MMRSYSESAIPPPRPTADKPKGKLTDLFRPGPSPLHRVASPAGPHPLEDSLRPLSPEDLRKSFEFPPYSPRPSTPSSPGSIPDIEVFADDSPPVSPISPKDVKFPEIVHAEVYLPRPLLTHRADTVAIMTSNGVANAARAKVSRHFPLSPLLLPTAQVLTFQLPQPRNLLFIEPGVDGSPATTPTGAPHNDPLDMAGALLNRAESTTPTNEGAPAQAPLPKPQRTGLVGSLETQLPNIHSEPSEYYGGQRVETRARTYSHAGVAGSTKRRPQQMDGEFISRNRRLSHGMSLFFVEEDG